MLMSILECVTSLSVFSFNFGFCFQQGEVAKFLLLWFVNMEAGKVVFSPTDT